MFYSRPKIEPLGWDLVELPTPEGSRNHEGLTSDGRPVDFRFSSGWLTVKQGPVGAIPGASAETTEMEEVISVPIAPFGIMDIQPEQICDILGLTVDGRRIDSAGIHTASRGFDWSGVTTYWQSAHRLLPDDEARIFVDRLMDAFPGSILVQPEWGSFGLLRCRQIRFLLKTDGIAVLGIDGERSRVGKLLSGEQVSTEEFEETFGYSIELSHSNNSWDEPTGSRYVHQNGGADLDYSVVHHRQYRIRTRFRTADEQAQARTAKLLAAIGDYFERGLRMVNLKTGATIAGNMPDDCDEQSYSKELKARCLEKDKRYLFVGKTLPEDPVSGGESVFYGARPHG
jgi:hypothetical protein